MRVTLLTIMIALLSACSGEKGKIVLQGELNGLRQSKLLIWNNDGRGSMKIDTVEIESGHFEYKAEADEEESSWTLVYPNMSTLTFFGSSGDVLKLKGQANELRMVEVTGTPENELYTALRRGDITADSLITAHPTSIVARHVFRTMYVDNDKASRATRARLYKLMCKANPDDAELARWGAWAQAKEPLKVGKRLPHFSVITSQGDTITDSTFLGSRLFIGVWWSSEVDSRSMLRAFREERRKAKGTKKKKAQTKVELLTFNIDIDSRMRATFERIDSIDWHRVNTCNLFDHPLLRRWNIDTAPYIIMVDTAGIVRAMGTDFEHDIKPKL